MINYSNLATIYLSGLNLYTNNLKNREYDKEAP